MLPEILQTRTDDGARAINSEKYGGPLLPAGLAQDGGESERARRLLQKCWRPARLGFAVSCFVVSWFSRSRLFCFSFYHSANHGGFALDEFRVAAAVLLWLLL